MPANAGSGGYMSLLAGGDLGVARPWAPVVLHTNG